MGARCHPQPPERSPRRGAGGAALPGTPLLLLCLLLASSISACKGLPEKPWEPANGRSSVQRYAGSALMGKRLWQYTTIRNTLPGAPMPSQPLESDEDLHLLKEIDEACSAYLSTDSQPQVSSTLEELCFFIMGFLQKPQDLDEKDNTKRFLFHYSKSHDSGNSDIMSSVLHPLLQLVPQLNERRLKRYKLDEELQGPGMIQSRGYFFYRPRNGRRSVGFR